jgi:hypothetical protein
VNDFKFTPTSFLSRRGGGAAKTGGGKEVDAAGGVTVEYVLSSEIRKENLHTKMTNTDTISYVNIPRDMPIATVDRYIIFIIVLVTVYPQTTDSQIWEVSPLPRCCILTIVVISVNARSGVMKGGRVPDSLAPT